VLWLEDEALLRGLVATIAESAPSLNNLEIHWVVDGDEAWKVMASSNPDIFITDLLHPGLSASKLLELLSAKQANVPVGIFTGYADPREFAAARFPHLRLRFLGKPFRMEELVEFLNALAGDLRP
jgi:DNA-binding NtrC family response regulator